MGAVSSFPGVAGTAPDCGLYCLQGASPGSRRHPMKVSDILRVKGNTLYTASPDEPLSRAIEVMAQKDIGSLVGIEHAELVGILTFREVIVCIVDNGGVVGDRLVRSAMDD